MAASSTSFKKDKQPVVRKPRGKGKKSLMLDAIKAVCGNEKDFLEQVVTIGLGGWTSPEAKEDEEVPEPVFQQPNPMLLNMVLNRIEPPLKSISAPVNFKLKKKSSPYEQSLQIVEAIADGEIPPDIGVMMVGAVASMLKIQEVTDIDERLKEMELKLDAQE